MSYTPAQNDPTTITGSVVQVTASGNLTFGREHEISGSAAVSMAIPTPTRNGSLLGVKVAEEYTGSGVTITPPSGLAIGGASTFAMVAGQEAKFFYDGTTIRPE